MTNSTGVARVRGHVYLKCEKKEKKTVQIAGEARVRNNDQGWEGRRLKIRLFGNDGPGRVIDLLATAPGDQQQGCPEKTQKNNDCFEHGAPRKR